MFNFQKILNFCGLGKQKIVFCYFEPHTYDYTPLDIGYLLAILKEKCFFGEYEFKLMPLPDFLYFDSDRVTQKVSESSVRILTDNPAAVFFFADNLLVSLVRGTERAQKIAAMIKKSAPKTFIGLQSYKFTPAQMRKIFATHKIDCLIPGDPEKTFLFLEKIIGKEKVGGAPRNFLEIEKEKNGSIESGDNGSKKFLDSIPSPYLSGALDGFLREKKQTIGRDFICFLQSARGCSFGCYYCPRSVKFEQARCFSVKRFYDEIEYLIARFDFKSFFVIDDTFVFSKKRLVEFQHEFEKRKKKNKKLDEINFFVMTRPEILDAKTIEILRSLNVKEIQIGLQTINPELQCYMHRKIEVSKFSELARDLKKAQIRFLLDVIGGLPGDTIEWFKKTVDFATSLAPDRIQVKQLFLTPETKFYREKEKFGIEVQRFTQESLEPYVTRANGIDATYNAEAYAYTEKKKIENPQIKWLISSETKNSKSSGFNRRF